MIFANVEFLFVFVTFNSKLQSLFIVQPKHSSQISLKTGRLSPVNIDSSTLAHQLITSQSRAIFSPDLTSKISPTFISSISFSKVFQSFNI
jgi:hypothetical protein